MRYGMVIDLARCIGCTACTVACKTHNGTPKDIAWAQVLVEEKGSYPNSAIEVTPVLCMHCRNAPCVAACPTGASYRGEDGIVHIDKDKCIGCRACMVACPYNARKFMFSDPESYYPGQEMTALERSRQEQFPKGVVTKCEFCSERLAEGLLPACVATCPAHARIFGDLDDQAGQVNALIAQKSGQPLHPQVGTKPSVYYLPR